MSAKKSPKSNDKKRVTGRRTDWEVNDQLISQTFAELLLKNGKMPTYAAIGRELGIDEKKVERHLKEVDFTKRFQKFRSASDKVLINLFKQCATGKNPLMIKLWLELFEGLGEKKKVDITSGGEPLTIKVVRE